MFGWEFPPFISGGLGTACYGIVQGLLKNNIDVTFVVPSMKGLKSNNICKVIDANEISISDYELKKRLLAKNIFIRNISPYIINLPKRFSINEEQLEFFRSSGILAFTGNYGENLMREVFYYSIIGRILGENKDFDIIHCHDWLSYPAGIAAKQVSGKPLVVHIHATEFDRSGENINHDVYNIEKEGFEKADKIVAVSYYTKNILINRYGIFPDKIKVVHNAVSKETHIQRFGIKKPLKEKIVLFLGRVTMQKGPEYFIQAASLVLKKMKNVRFVMAGSGDMLTRMISYQAFLKMSRNFHFTGFLQDVDVERMYAVSDLFVMPSVSEPFGIAAFEALLFDVPVIISKQSGVSEVLPEAVTVDFWDVYKLADTIVDLLKHEKKAKSVALACKKRLENICWELVGQKLSMIYSELIGG